MKRILLSLSVIAMFFAGNSQTLLTENFDAMTAGDIGAQGGWSIYPDPMPEAQVVSVASGDNALQLSGVATATGTKYVYQSIDWEGRNTGNDVLFTSFSIKTGPSTSSLNSFDIRFYDNVFNNAFGMRYTPSNHVVEGLIYDTDKTYLVTLGATAPVLADDNIYQVSMWYDVAESQAFWHIADAAGTLVAVAGTNFTNTNTITELNFVSRAGAGNTAATHVYFDDVTVKARPCLYYDSNGDASFSFSSATLCLTGADVSPTITNTGISNSFSSDPSTGLDIETTTGLISPSSSTAGTYVVTNNTCDNESTQSITIQDCAGLPEHLSSAFSVAPNPAKEFFTVTLSDNVEANGVIRLMTSEGKEVESRIVTSNKEEVFNVSDLDAGIYFVQFADKIEKVVVQ